MNVHDRMRLRQWDRLVYHDSAHVLREARRAEWKLQLAGLVDPRVGVPRTRQLRHHHEGRQAALFAYGLGRRLGTEVFFAFAPSGDLDYDFVLRFQLRDALHSWPLQVKEVVPERFNARATLEGLLADLKKYGDARDLCVVVYVDRRLPPSSIEVPALEIGSLWLVGGASPDHQRWFLHGDLMADSYQRTEFRYPEPRVIVP